MLRLWIAEEGLHCSIKIGMYTENGDVVEANAWGVILADAARHIASALHKGYALNESATLDQICGAFLDHLVEEQPHMQGGFLNESE
ncbi:hypothetical protein JCM19000A_42850 [Silvimonas sp. JCM 19000]